MSPSESYTDSARYCGLMQMASAGWVSASREFREDPATITPEERTQRAALLNDQCAQPVPKEWTQGRSPACIDGTLRVRRFSCWQHRPTRLVIVTTDAAA